MDAEKTIHVITRAVIVKDEQLLVCVGQQNHYVFLPGGHVEHGESSSDALKRELEEELGLKSTIKRFLGCFEYAYEGMVTTNVYGQIITRSKPLCHSHEINLIFEVEIPELKAGIVPQSPEDHTTFEWIPLSADEHKVHFLPTSLLPLISGWLKADQTCAFASKMRNSI